MALNWVFTEKASRQLQQIDLVPPPSKKRQFGSIGSTSLTYFLSDRSHDTLLRVEVVQFLLNALIDVLHRIKVVQFLLNALVGYPIADGGDQLWNGPGGAATARFGKSSSTPSNNRGRLMKKARQEFAAR